MGIFLKVPQGFENHCVDGGQEATGIDILILRFLRWAQGLRGHSPLVPDAHGVMKVSALGLSKGFKQGALCHPGSEMCICVCVCDLSSVWTQESMCQLIETNIRDQEELEGKKVAQYPCLWVNVSAVGRWAVLYHTEDTWDQNQQVLTDRCVGLSLTGSLSLLWRAEAEKGEPTRPGTRAGVRSSQT